MHAQLRRTSTVAVALVGTLAVGLAIPDQAHALVSPPAPVSLPSSVLGAEAGTATAGATIGSLTASGGTAVATGDAVAAGGLTAGAEAAGGASAVGLVVGWALGKQIVKAQGWPTTGNFLCDVQWALDSTASCAVKPGQTWTVNADAVSTPAGWADNVNYATGMTNSFAASYWGGGWTQADVTVNVTSAPAYHASSGTVTFTVTFNGTCVGGGSSGVGFGATVAGPGESLYLGGMSPPCSAPVQTVTKDFASSDSRYTFDHLHFAVTGHDDYSPTHSLDWYPEGYPNRPAGESGDPVRTWLTDWLCTDGSHHTVTSNPFHETDPEWPGLPTASCDGSAVQHETIYEVTGSTSKVISEYTMPDAAKTWANSADPNCVAGKCQLLLYRVDQSGALLNCFSSSSVCANWWTETQQATTGADQYRCQLGATVEPLAECQVYSHAFDQGVYADPRTGQTTSTGTSPDPGTSPQDESCPPPFSWSALFNTWWAFKATSCALQEGFEPKASQAQVQAIADEVKTKAPVVELGSVFAWLAPPTGGSACLVWTIPVRFIDKNVPVLNSCDPNDPMVQALTPIRLLLGIVVWVSMFAPLAWWAWKQYAPGSQGVA